MSLSSESLDRVLELACIDLIQRNRRGDPARVEEYLQKHPALMDPAYLLDLVDAEICVRKELGETVKVGDWSERFPHQANAIQQLIALEVSVNEFAVAGASLPPDVMRASPETSRFIDPFSYSAADLSSAESDALTVAGSDSFSEQFVGDALPNPTSLFPSPPIKPPHGFIVDSGVSVRPGVWLLRCHEEGAQQPCSFKIMNVARSKPGQLSSFEVKSILDACERAAKIRHPVWVQPFVATCDGRFLGVFHGSLV